MLLSGSTLSTDQFGVRRYESNKKVEQAGYIGSKIAYRYQYQTNNLGFVSEYDYVEGQRLGLLIVGDSMTEGQEAGPWLDVIQRQLFNQKGVTTQNAGIAGNGFVEFEKAATFAKTQLDARKLMVIFIPDDMYRYGDVMVANRDCSTYKEYTSTTVNCNSGRPTWHHYESKLSDNELATFAEGKALFGLLPTMKRPALDMAKRGVKVLCQFGLRINSTSALAVRINSECDASRPLTQKTNDNAPVSNITSTKGAAISPVPASNSNISPIPDITISAIRKMLNTYGARNVLFVMIPGGGHSFKVIQPQVVLPQTFQGEFDSPLQFADISESCEMAPTDWGAGGGHPTRNGYLKLQSCFLKNPNIMGFAAR